jgi:hypothetical protein
MMDAILFSAKRDKVDMNDAIEHLREHDKLYWSVLFPIDKKHFSFPMFGYIHISGEHVKYIAIIDDIIPFSSAHLANKDVKPEKWRMEWNTMASVRDEPWKHVLVITKIMPFECEASSLTQHRDGTPVKQPPQGYVRLIPPFALVSPNAIDDIGTDTPGRVSVLITRYARDPKIRGAVMQRAGGKCEYCGEVGFRREDGTRYLECHHIIALANEGADRMTNVIALCPHHHREAHFGERSSELEGEMIKKLLVLEGKASADYA